MQQVTSHSEATAPQAAHNPDGGMAHADGAGAIRIERLTKRFADVVAVDDVSLHVAGGEFVALLGPSGSGKTTILQSIAGFERPTAGQIFINGEDVTGVPVNRRDLGMVFQKYTLFPHLTLRDNVAFPLKMRNVSRSARRKAADAALARVRLEGYGDRMPSQISGGQQQRVALARAIVYEPKVLLMDEPLGALDRNLREQMQIEIKALQRELGVTVVFVTHDQEEALTMADRVAVISEGRLQQLADPETLYEAPANLFVAGFVGDNNLLPVTVVPEGNGVTARVGEARFPLTGAAHVGEGPVPAGPATLAVRPEKISVVAHGKAGHLTATLREIIYSGQSVLIITELAGGQTVRVRVPTKAAVGAARIGEPIGLAIPPDAARVFPAATP
ncbi:MAG: ABC transporter ATP-binding protein [Pseudomonadota bacterium]